MRRKNKKRLSSLFLILTVCKSYNRVWSYCWIVRSIIKFVGFDAKGLWLDKQNEKFENSNFFI